MMNGHVTTLETSRIGLFIIVFFIFVRITRASDECGGHLTASRGIIQTPNFPGEFPVPIKCRWVIDASNVPFGNSSIVVYLTQLYVYKGLKFTEYAYYESESSNFAATVIKEITERNVFEYRWFKTYRPFLVIEFVLERLEGNHVRVLHNLLDVYGFNITYEVAESDVNPNSCTVRDCSYAGDCILDEDFSTFSCQCFDEFLGEKCSDGPLCTTDNRNPICRNGGTCKHVGAEAVRCHCPPGYSGNSCEISLLNDKNAECGGDNCILQCPFIGKDRRPCDCEEPTKIFNNRARYEFKIKLTNATGLRGATGQPGPAGTLLKKQLAKHINKSNIESMEDLKILSVTPSAEVTLHFYGTSNDGDKIRDALNRLVQRKRLNDFILEPTHFTFQQKPSLRLQSLRVNAVNEREIRLGDQFILSCLAQSSNAVKFIWYKDNMLVNMSKAVREIWYKDLPNDGSDMHTSILTIDKAILLDAGQYTCQAIDWGMQQCKSIYIDVRDEPEVKVVPMSATIEKGNDIQLMCITPNMRSLGIGFGWTKNRALLKLEPGSQVWEDLYPAGSILKIMNAQKSAIYTCNVAHRSMSVRVDVVNRTMIPICTKENTWGLHWPDTGPGSESLLECPRQFVGPRVSRLCSMKDATTSVWQHPDFSDCLYQPFIAPYSNFHSLTLGYQNTSGSETVIALWEVLRSRKLALYPGEGDRILSILAEIEEYQNSIGDLDDLHNSAETMTRIMNRILNDEHSILTLEKQLLLQQLTLRNLEYWAKRSIHPYKHLALSSIVLDIQRISATFGSGDLLRIPADDYMYPYWYHDTVAIRLDQSDTDINVNKSFNSIVILYKNITRFMPSTYVKELEDGTDLEYHFNSRVITIALTPFSERHDSNIRIELKMKHIQNISGFWNVSCGIEDAFGVWDLDSCASKLIPQEGSTQCLCTKPGTFAVFLTARAIRVALAKNEQTTSIVLLGCSLCLLQCSIAALILGICLWKNCTWLNFLKLQCSTALIGAMGFFIYAIHGEIPETQYSIIAIGLELFLLIGISAPNSQALIIYADLTQLRPGQHFQPTVIAVITGLPILCVLTTELSHKSTGWSHESWWLIFGSGVYKIFVVCAATMFSMFMLLYTGVLWKAHILIEQNVMKKETIQKRIGMLHRAAFVLCGLITVEFSSIFYINSTAVIWHYVFGSLSSLLGSIVLFTYIGAGEVILAAPILRRFKSSNDNEVKSDPIKVCSKSELENDSAPGIMIAPAYMEARGVAAGSIDMRDYLNETPSYSKTPAPPPTRYPPEVRIDANEDIHLMNYSTSPRKYQETVNFDSSNFSRATHCGTEFYGVSSKGTFGRDPTIFVGSREVQTCNQPMIPESSAKVLCNADVEAKMNLNAMPDVTLATQKEVEILKVVEVNRDHVNIIPDIASTGERKQPDGEEKNPEITVTDCENTTTGMLDRISHDLDYLLNRTQTSEEA